MAKQKIGIFPLDTDIEVIAINGNNIVKKTMKYSEALNLPKKKGWVYKFYEIGFSQFELSNR